MDTDTLERNPTAGLCLQDLRRRKNVWNLSQFKSVATIKKWQGNYRIILRNRIYISTLLVLLMFTEKASGGERAGTIKFGHSSERAGINCHISGHKCTCVCAAGVFVRFQIQRLQRTEGCFFLRRAVMSWHRCLGGLTVYSEIWAHVPRLGQTIWVLTAEDESPES